MKAPIPVVVRRYIEEHPEVAELAGSRPDKAWWASKRFWSGALMIVSGGAGVCNLVGKGNKTVSAVGIGFGALAAALRIWLGEKDGANQVRYPVGLQSLTDPLQRIEAARGTTARWGQFKQEARKLAATLGGNGTPPA